MSHVKGQSKRQIKTPRAARNAADDIIPKIPVPKEKIARPIDIIEEVLPLLESDVKPDDDIVAEEAETEAEEAALDGEEIDPFGDKWEQ